MSGHTKGPWFVEQDGKTPIYVSPIDRHEEIAICNVLVIDEDPDDDSGEWFNGDQTKANARLIAAAPDLLEALEVISRLYDYEATSGENSSRLYDARSIALLAIAKARGEK